MYNNFPQGLTKNKVRKALKKILIIDCDENKNINKIFDYDWEL